MDRCGGLWAEHETVLGPEEWEEPEKAERKLRQAEERAM